MIKQVIKLFLMVGALLVVMLAAEGVTNKNTISEHEISESVKQTYKIKVYDFLGLLLGQELGSGTGVLISNDGKILTNAHVAGHEGAFLITATDYKGNEYAVDVVKLGDKKEADLALLQIKEVPKTLPQSVMLGDTAKMSDRVYSVGHPLGYNVQYVEGKVRSTFISKYSPQFFPVELHIYPGNSGGGLFNTKGELVGVTSAITQNFMPVKVYDKAKDNVTDSDTTFVAAGTGMTLVIRLDVIKEFLKGVI